MDCVTRIPGQILSYIRLLLIYNLGTTILERKLKTVFEIVLTENQI